MPLTYERGDCRIIVDDRYAPVLISTFIGNSDAAAAKWFMESQMRLMQELARQGKKVASISDATRASNPTPDGRRAWADSMKNQDPQVKAATIANVVVFTSALIRGAVTAIGWMNEEVRSVKSVGTMKEAIAMVRSAYTQQGHPAPALPEDYELPSGDSSRVAAGN